VPESSPPCENCRKLSLANKRNAHISWAKTPDWSARTFNARMALEQKFLDQADGDPKRAQQFRKAFYAELSQKSAESRRRNRGAA
jgi:hypothetical protein